MIYLCSFEDKKGQVRFEKFNRWFRNDDFHQELVKIDGVIGAETDYYTRILHHKENPKGEKIKNDFLNIVTDLDEK